MRPHLGNVADLPERALLCFPVRNKLSSRVSKTLERGEQAGCGAGRLWLPPPSSEPAVICSGSFLLNTLISVSNRLAPLCAP